MCFTTKLAHKLRNISFRNVSERAFQSSFPEIQISCVLRGISFRGCESLVFVTYLNLSVSALYSTLIQSTPLHSTPLLCRYSEQINTRKQVLVSNVIPKKLIFVMSVSQRAGAAAKNVEPGNVSDASTQWRVWETSQLRLHTVTARRYKTKHVCDSQRGEALYLWCFRLASRLGCCCLTRKR